MYVIDKNISRSRLPKYRSHVLAQFIVQLTVYGRGAISGGWTGINISREFQIFVRNVVCSLITHLRNFIVACPAICEFPTRYACV